MNTAILKGRLAEKPELKHLPTGTQVANFSLATNERWTDKQGQKQERTEWHRCMVFGKTAEVMNNHLSKGDEVLVTGKIQSRQWEDKQGNKRTITEINVNNFEFCGSRNKTDNTVNTTSNTMMGDDIPW